MVAKKTTHKMTKLIDEQSADDVYDVTFKNLE